MLILIQIQLVFNLLQSLLLAVDADVDNGVRVVVEAPQSPSRRV